MRGHHWFWVGLIIALAVWYAYKKGMIKSPAAMSGTTPPAGEGA